MLASRMAALDLRVHSAATAVDLDTGSTSAVIALLSADSDAFASSAGPLTRFARIPLVLAAQGGVGESAALAAGAAAYVPSEQLEHLEHLVAAQLRRLEILDLLDAQERAVRREGELLRQSQAPESDATAGLPELALLVDPECRVAYVGRSSPAATANPHLGRKLGEDVRDRHVGRTVRAARLATHAGLRMEVPTLSGGPGWQAMATVVPLPDVPVGSPWRLLLASDVGRHPAAADLALRPELGLAPRAAPALMAAAREDAARRFPFLHDGAARTVGALARHVEGREPLLVWGEGGTGRRFLARLVHYRGGGGGLLEVPCDFLEGDSAVRTLVQYLEAARGAAVLLHDVDTLPQAVRSELARRPELSPRPPPDAARILATAQSLEGPDLFAIAGPAGARAVRLPSLREAPGEIPALAARLARAHGAVDLEEAAAAALATYDWPGNLGELDGVVAAAAAAGAENGLVRFEDLPTEIRSAAQESAEGLLPGDSPGDWEIADSDPISLDFYERKAIQRALEVCSDDRTAAARMLAISESGRPARSSSDSRISA